MNILPIITLGYTAYASFDEGCSNVTSAMNLKNVSNLTIFIIIIIPLIDIYLLIKMRNFTSSLMFLCLFQIVIRAEYNIITQSINNTFDVHKIRPAHFG